MQLTIPKPCHENWDLMTPNKKGRFCQICSKTVRDFSNLSDSEIIESLDNTTNICANMNADQLNKNLSHSFINSLFSKFAVGFILTAVGFVEINAQQTNIKQDTVIAKQTRGKVVTHSQIKNDTFKKKPVIVRVGEVQSIKENDPPLYILDGKLIDDRTFKNVDPNTIEKVEVVKGLSATALFGSKGKNGAIIITSKKKSALPKSKIQKSKD